MEQTATEIKPLVTLRNTLSPLYKLPSNVLVLAEHISNKETRKALEEMASDAMKSTKLVKLLIEDFEKELGANISDIDKVIKEVIQSKQEIKTDTIQFKIPDDFDEVMDKALKSGWGFKNGKWTCKNYKGRNSQELYNFIKK